MTQPKISITPEVQETPEMSNSEYVTYASNLYEMYIKHSEKLNWLDWFNGEVEFTTDEWQPVRITFNNNMRNSFQFWEKNSYTFFINKVTSKSQINEKGTLLNFTIQDWLIAGKEMWVWDKESMKKKDELFSYLQEIEPQIWNAMNNIKEANSNFKKATENMQIPIEMKSERDKISTESASERSTIIEKA